MERRPVDVYWNPAEGELTNNVCPPSTEYVRAGFSGGYTDRSPSSIDITAEPPTIIHVPRSAMVDLSTTTEYTRERYPDIWKADDAENRPNAEGTPVPGKGDGIVWVLPPCPHVGNTSAVGDLCLSFSAFLLKSTDWHGNIKFHLDKVDTDRQEPRYTLAYDVRPGSIPARGGFQPVWNSKDVDTPAMEFAPGRYENATWIFTSRGTYELQVHITGNPNSTLSTEPNVSSDQRKYILHVGPLTLNEDPAFEVGRSVEEHSAVGTPVGDAIPVYQGDDDDLTFSLTGPGHDLFSVEADTDGNAQIKVTGDLDYEAFSEYRLVLGVRDNKSHWDSRDTAVDSTISVKINVADVLEQPVNLERSVNENATGGTSVGDAIAVANATASTSYTLTGDGEDLFAVENSSGDAQIKVAPGIVINYEDAPSYDLTLHADTAGTEDVSVIIHVVDDPNEQLAIALTADPSDATQTVGDSVVFSGTVTGSPVATSRLEYGWFGRDRGGGNGNNEVLRSPSKTVTGTRAATREYRMRVWWREDGEAVENAHSNWIVIDWQAQ